MKKLRLWLLKRQYRKEPIILGDMYVNEKGLHIFMYEVDGVYCEDNSINKII